MGNLIKQAMESIEFQSSSVGKSFEIIFERARSSGKTIEQLIEKGLAEDLEDLIKVSFGLKIKLHLNESIMVYGPAAVIPTRVTAGHIFDEAAKRQGMVDFVNGSIDNVLKKAKVFSNVSTVDLKNAKVSGLFSEIECPIFFNLHYWFVEKYSTRTIVSVLMHEIGHAFTFFEFCNRTIRANQAMALISKSIMNKDTGEARKYYIEEVGLISCNDKNAFKELSDVTDLSITYSVIVDRVQKKAISELGTTFYDYTSAEFLADQFMSRMGYGRDFLAAINDFNIDATPSKFIQLVQIVTISFTFLALTGLFGITIISGNPIVGVYSAIWLLISVNSFIISNDYKQRDFTYDIFKTRVKRVKEDSIQNLKINGKHMPKSQVISLIEDIEYLDKAIKYVNEGPTYIEKIFFYFSQKSRDMYAAVQLQRDLEELASNDLFVKSAKLLTI